MRVIPVIDLKAGQAVHAVAGRRAHYRPVQSRLHAGSDPLGLALAYRDVLGLHELYLADLDAIAGAPPSLALIGALAAVGLRVWVDAGLRDRQGLEPLLAAGAAVAIAGLETVRGPAALAGILAKAGAERVAFSLDLDAGRPLVAPGADWGTHEPLAIASGAIAQGVRALVLLDLARVGTGQGTGTEALIVRLRAAHPEAALIAGGGIGSAAELRALALAGATAALVGSALHDGRIGRAEIG